LSASQSTNANPKERKVDQTLVLIIGAALLIGLLFLPQWQARRRREKQMTAMHPGSEVMTIGGIIGKLTYVNAEENRARIEIAPGVEIQVIVSAVGQVLTPAPDDSAEPPPDEGEEVESAWPE
jgi:preprotein translocase subunit YajC